MSELVVKKKEKSAKWRKSQNRTIDPIVLAG